LFLLPREIFLTSPNVLPWTFIPYRMVTKIHTDFTTDFTWADYNYSRCQLPSPIWNSVSFFLTREIFLTSPNVLPWTFIPYQMVAEIHTDFTTDFTWAQPRLRS